jgi:aldose 1-epimerase
MVLDSVTIIDVKAGSQAKILPGLGFNCYSFSVTTPTGPLETLWSEPALATGTTKPTRSGIPLLFPFAGRIGGTTFRFRDKTYELEAGDGAGNAIHGFLFNRPWRVIEQAANRIVGRFQASVDEASLLEHWPADFRITVEYSIAGRTLTSALWIENPDDKPLPFGLGMHPYFRVPLGGAAADDCVVTIPVSECWELKSLVPTGKQLATTATQELSRGMPVGGMQLDNVFGGLKFDKGRATCAIHDPASSRTVKLSFGERFTTCVVFNPPHREAVCMEPYTTVPDPFRLQESGIDPNLEVLAPGESFRATVEIRVD